jgi:hypothetical protein
LEYRQNLLFRTVLLTSAVPKRVISCACSLQEPGKVQGIDERNEQKSQKLSFCHWHAILHALDLGHFRSVKNAKSLL